MNDLPINPLTGLTAIGWRNARRTEVGRQPIWPQLGGSEAADDQDGDGGDEEQDEAADGRNGDGDQDGEGRVEGEDALGDAGKRALDKMKADLRAEKTRRKTAEADLAKAQVSQQQSKPDDAPDLDKLREQALTQAREETLRERALDKLEARAARRFKDSADAAAHLGSRLGEFVDGGKIDTQAIDEAIDDLLEAKPYLAAATATGRPHFEGTGDGGARKGSTGTVQLTDADLKKMTPAQIDEAHRKGQFDELLGKKR